MTDLVSQLVGALEGLMALEENHQRYPGDEDVCKEVQDARAALTAAKAGGWLPIETAPKDGTVVILGRAEDDASVVTTGHWQEAEEDGVDYMGADAGFVDEHYQEFKPGRSFGSPSYRYAPTQPTAWQPLPNPPKEQSAGGLGSVDAVANPLSPT